MGYYTGGDYYMAGGGWDFIQPALGFLRGLGKSNTGTPTNILGTAAGKLGLPFTSQQQLSGGPANPLLAGGFSVEAGGRKRRRMNPLNPRALRRALSRARSFEKFARRTVSLTTRMKFKKRRRR